MAISFIPKEKLYMEGDIRRNSFRDVIFTSENKSLLKCLVTEHNWLKTEFCNGLFQYKQL